MTSLTPRLSITALMVCGYCFSAPPPEVNVCPQAVQSFRSGLTNVPYENAVAASGTCNQTIVFGANGAVTTLTGNPNAFNGGTGSLIGVVNNSSAPVTSFKLSNPGAVPAIFDLTTNGICGYTPFPANSQPCYPDSPGASNYGGNSSGYSGINGALDTGTINFAAGIPPGGSGYFSLAGPAVINVASAASLTQVFTPDTIPLSGTSTLTFTISNPNAVPLSAVSFSDSLPLGISAGTGSSPFCGGRLTLSGSSLAFSGGTLAAAVPPATTVCSFSVTINGNTSGSYTNQTSIITAVGPDGTPAQPGPAATAPLTVQPPLVPTFSKGFFPIHIGVGGMSTLIFAIANPNSAAAITGIGITDNFPAGLTIASPAAVSNTCGGTVTAGTGAGGITLAGGALAGGASCTLRVNVMASAGGLLINVTAPLISSAGAGNVATATLTVAAPPLLTESFNSAGIPPGASTLLTFVVSNPNAGVALSGISFSDSLPAGLAVSSPSGLHGTCAGATAPAGSSLITVAGVSLAPSSSCNITVSVTGDGSVNGQQTNTTSTVASNEAAPGDPASATLFLGDAFQFSYFTNLNSGDSVINVTNAASMPVTTQTGITASVTGALCANVYSFSPDEQVVSCCSCPVTPNGIVAYSVSNDIVANRLNGSIPSSVVVKLLATVPIAGTCVNSAAAAAPLALGMAAWGTKLHAALGINAETGTQRFSLTEAPFTSSSLSNGELNRIRTLCNLILSQGSGNGVCSACRSNGLGAEKQ